MDLSGPYGPGMGLEVTRQNTKEPYIHHFPDGNASIARLLVRKLIPGSAPGNSMEDIVLSKVNYSSLDDSASPVRIRLNSTVAHAANAADRNSPAGELGPYVRHRRAPSRRPS